MFVQDGTSQAGSRLTSPKRLELSSMFLRKGLVFHYKDRTSGNIGNSSGGAASDWALSDSGNARHVGEAHITSLSACQCLIEQMRCRVCAALLIHSPNRYTYQRCLMGLLLQRWHIAPLLKLSGLISLEK